MTTSTHAATGASGHLGRLAVHELLAGGMHASYVVAVVRTRDKAGDIADSGVQVREVDYSHQKLWWRRWAAWSGCC